MQRKAGRVMRALLIGAFLVLGQTGLTAAATPPPQTPATQPSGPAQTPPGGTLSVVPPIIAVTVQPGGSTTADVTIHAAQLETVALQADGLGQASDGSFQFLPASEDTSAYSARSMMTFSPASFQIQPGGSQKVSVTIQVPASAGNGTRYGVLRITGTPGTGDQNVGIGVELGVPALVTLADTSLSHTGAVQGLSVDTTPGNPLRVKGQIKNTGNSHYGAVPNQVNASAILYDSSGKDIAEGRTTLDGNSIVPTFSRAFDIAMPSARNLAAGRYRIEVSAILQDGTVLNRAAIAFDVTNGQVEGATGVPVQGASNGGSGSDPTALVLVGLGGLLLGAVLVAGFVVAGRRPKRVAA